MPSEELSEPDFDTSIESLPPRLRMQVLKQIARETPKRHLHFGEFILLVFGLIIIGIVWTVPLILLGLLCMVTLVLIPAGVALWAFATMPMIALIGIMARRRMRIEE